MAIIKTVLNYNRAIQTNFSDFISIPLSTDVETLLLEWGHTIPEGVEFVEVNACVGWEGAEAASELELLLYMNGVLVATVEDQADDFDPTVDTTTNFKAILNPPPDAPGTQTVFQLRAINRGGEGAVEIEGPLNASSISYGRV
ncbi:hypothetical protein KZ483_22320 [Paenibacillus sp. sptzw28]|uniref:hypothetical protein n=1 Tax=Paenibacillus sp. sptzw28 TaxID=715179 RepID=UPI001C6E0131|nr:hypothetical protein [Paenibacillus sp. sptzw28]QYR20512.1 hypothetical protein KZ483_22320 [Paenibacillus sp. sptzw28]